MDQVKIGKFISKRRKELKITQTQLADRLNITDRAVSKWERGRAMPDSSIMLKLCEILNITVNDLLSGEKVSLDKYNEELESNLIKMVKDKEKTDKTLLCMEIVVGVLCLIPIIASILLVNFIQMEEWLASMIVGFSCVPIFVVAPLMIKIEQVAGYYECGNCGHRYVPKYKSVFGAMHLFRTRYMKCPKCGKRTWQKKVISK